MSYKIIEVHITYKKSELESIAVLWEENERGYVKATYATNKPCTGFKFLKADEILSPDLLQEVASNGMELSDVKKKRYFSGKRKWGK